MDIRSLNGVTTCYGLLDKTLLGTSTPYKFSVLNYTFIFKIEISNKNGFKGSNSDKNFHLICIANFWLLVKKPHLFAFL